MSKTHQSLQYICKSCRQSILRSPSSRAFSNSVSRSNTIPTFEPTSSAELDALLSDWRRRVFTPAALNANHQALVYKKSRHAIIENDPGVTVTMSDGEDIKLEPMVAFDKPNKHKSLAKIAELLGSTKEYDAWSQLPQFLEGMQLAKQAVPFAFLEKITRKANEQGRSGVIKKCASMVSKTGLSLAMRPVTRELFLGIHNEMVEARIAGEDYGGLAGFADNLLSMLDSEEHCGGKLQEAKSQQDMRKDLTVVGVRLELAAAMCIDWSKGKDEYGLTGNMSQKLIALSEDGILPQFKNQKPQIAIEDWIVIANGIRLALKVEGLLVGKGRNAEKELKNALQNRLSELDAAIKDEIAKIRAAASGKPRRALIMFEKLKQVS